MPTRHVCIASLSPSRTSDAYIYSLVPASNDGLVASTSADEIVLVNRQNLAANQVEFLNDPPKGLTCLAPGSADGQEILCAGSDGQVARYDTRSRGRVSQFKLDRAVTALKCNGNAIAIGTELAHHQAIVCVWDARTQKQIWQNSENNDDITVLDFHPSRKAHLLAGGDDGVVSIFDTTIADEEESLLQAINHGPIHKAGFLGTDRVFALSSDQNFSIHPVSTPDDNEDPPPMLFGDLRPRIPCQYVIDVAMFGGDYAVVAGTNIGRSIVDILKLKNAVVPGLDVEFDLDSRQVIEPAHGEEVVRALVYDDLTSTIFTAGEDGQIQAFRANPPGEAESSTPNKTLKYKKGSESRYKPY